MVYYFTSKNVKMIRNILLDYDTTSDTTPHEYMKMFIQKSPKSIEDAKLSWIVETFLGIQKHVKFLREIAYQLSDNSSEAEQDYFTITLYGIIFQIAPTDSQHLYKCLFNLSRCLLDTVSSFLKKNVALDLIYQIAESVYDTKFITDKIIAPICQWQPYVSEMADKYAEYVKKINSKKSKLPTIPMQPNVLNRKGKEKCLSSVFPDTPHNSICYKEKKMLTKSCIDQRLKDMHNKNQEKAAQLLHTVKNYDSHYAQGKSDKFYQAINDIQNDQYKIPVMKSKKNVGEILPQLEVKETAATIKRMNKRIKITEQQEIQWLQDLMDNCHNTTKIKELAEYDRQEKERKRLIDIEKKHLMGQISYEEAVIAKKRMKNCNKKKHDDFLKEKQMWENEIENWKKIMLEKNRKVVEELSLLELKVMESKNNAIIKKKEMAEAIKKESEIIIAKAMTDKQEELEHRINMIKEIKVLSMIAKKAKLPKIIDLTESSGLGLLCEMSIAELQERLSTIKISVQEELQKKRELIRIENMSAKQELDNTKQIIKNYLEDRKAVIKENEKVIMNTNTKEVRDLKRLLEEKRKLRIQLTK